MTPVNILLRVKKKQKLRNKNITKYIANKIIKLLLNMKSSSFKFALTKSIHGTKVNVKRTNNKIIF